MASRALLFRREEAAGLVVAVAAHLALVVWLMLKPPVPAPLPEPERMTVTFADQVASQSTSPNPAAQAAPAVAPVIAEQPVPEPAPQPQKPQPQKPQPAKPQPAKVPPAKAQPALAEARAGGGSRLGSDFLKGLPGGQTPKGRDTAPPAQAIGPAVRSALAGAMARQLKPRWVAPQGAEADQLVTVLSWDLNPDGSLAGAPRVVSQSGITDANRTQAQRHAEQAIRAVRLAAPFDLPDNLYPAWKHVAQFRFDRKLSQ